MLSYYRAPPRSPAVDYALGPEYSLGPPRQMAPQLVAWQRGGVPGMGAGAAMGGPAMSTHVMGDGAAQQGLGPAGQWGGGAQQPVLTMLGPAGLQPAGLAMRPGEGGQPAMSAPGMHTLPTPSFVGQPVEQPQMYMVPMALVQQGRSPPQGGAAHLQPMQPMRMQHPSALDGRGQPHAQYPAPQAGLTHHAAVGVATGLHHATAGASGGMLVRGAGPSQLDGLPMQRGDMLSMQRGEMLVPGQRVSMYAFPPGAAAARQHGVEHPQQQGAGGTYVHLTAQTADRAHAPILDGATPMPQYPGAAQPMPHIEYVSHGHLHYPGITAQSEEQTAQEPMSGAGSAALPQAKRPRTGHGVYRGGGTSDDQHGH